MHALMLCYRGEPIREFPLNAGPLEVGSSAGCDIVIEDRSVRGRQLLVQPRNGTVVVVALDSGEARPLPPNEPMAVGREHSIVRVPDSVPHRRRSWRTEQLPHPRASSPELSLVVGGGPDARRVALDPRPLSVGSGRDNRLVVSDRAVSASHCRFEPGDDGLRVRDLGSRNGTFVDGVPVTLARVGPGSTIRVGRTDLRLVARGSAPSAPVDAGAPSGLVVASPSMRDVLARVDRYARFQRNVLVTGESGAGKELIARALHDRGVRAAGPFVAINAGGMPASLVESELFGHEKGAFTGASAARRGLFEQAHGGTLFLDEIGELPLELQSRLLRVLETWRVRRVGGEGVTTVDVRVVCATHRDLRRMVAEGTFRQDLYFRLAQLRVAVPPLRERPEDVEALAPHFLAAVAEEVGPRRFTDDALSCLCEYDWPGNVRELKSVVENTALHHAGRWLTREDVASEIEALTGARPEPGIEQLQKVIEQHAGNLAAAARALGLPRTTLRDRLRAIDRERKKAS